MLSVIQIKGLSPTDLCMPCFLGAHTASSSFVDAMTSRLGSLCALDLLWLIRDEPAVRP